MPTPPTPPAPPSGTAGEGDDRGRLHTSYPGAPVENRRQLMVKLCWMLLWMIYLVYPVQDLTDGHHGPAATTLGALALIAFLACYLGLIILRNAAAVRRRGTVATALAAMLGLALATTLTLGDDWLTLFAYLSVAVGAVLPVRWSLPGVGVVTALLVAVGGAVHTGGDSLPGIALSAFLGGAAMTGLQRLVATMRELREAREAVAHLAAADERLRLARDLHDLLGHSLSLITLKSELAGRFLEQERYDDARRQVADIEKVGRQSLVDVREAVGGYRRPKLAVELAAARTALTTAGVEVDATALLPEGVPGLGPEEEGALGWALREAVTNVVRHARGATRCTVGLDEQWEEDGLWAVLEVTDNGTGSGAVRAGRPQHGPGGSGLPGLRERLALAGGRLETGPGPRGRGFRLRARVPLRRTGPRSAAADTPPTGSVHS
ncbi:sensor histidine kinase [Streptacidiphilus griseoplanus]|uniref:sensor histidine kinase n=1 Tax=Peterkaempfera griseoplana TaxID=66896 RepID=UPI00099E678A|nr:histidine kinase [Peterkaempfera griseoplana]